MTETVRAFIAAPIPGAVRDHLSMLQERMKGLGFPRLKWVNPKSIHLTLKFFGEVPLADIDLIGEVMAAAAAGMAPITLVAGGLGAFPGVQRARVVWVALKRDTPVLLALQQRLETALGELGFPPEQRPFKGHLTLARVKDGIAPELLLKAFQELSRMESAAFAADRIILYKSDLKPSGAEYTPLVEAAFGQ